MRVTILPFNVVSVKGAFVEATTDSLPPLTGSCAMSAGPSYSTMTFAATVKVSVALVLKLPANSSSKIMIVSLTRSTPNMPMVTPAIPDTVTALSRSKLDRM